LTILRAKTALRRHSLSRPAARAVADGIISSEVSVFDYGCGHGSDVRLLASQGIKASGWDPALAPDSPKHPAEVVILSYVVNVIENAQERAEALKRAWELARSVLVVAARGLWDVRGIAGQQHEDGLVTRAGTFQKFFEQTELRNWIESCLGVQPVAAGPGLFYVFRDSGRAQGYLASRFRQRLAVPRQRQADVLFDRYRPAFDGLMSFFAERGRLPRAEELPAAAELSHELGSIRRAFAVVRRVTGGEGWEDIVRKRVHDLLVYIALAKFGRRPRFSQLPQDLQYDIRDFFGSYTAACETADRLLFGAGKKEAVEEACQRSALGKLTQNALYVHASAVPMLDPLLRVYEGSARVLSGEIPGANIVKLHRRRAQVSYLTYPRFDSMGHPTLTGGVTVNLARLEIDQRDYGSWPNPPVLHRKELFVAPGYPRRDMFARLTAAEERAGLLQGGLLIGTALDWASALKDRGFVVRGHRLQRRSPTAQPPA
jgi:DNA phosphorothioation-associated putative methyltransferase